VLDGERAVGERAREEALKVKLASLDLGLVEVCVRARGGLELLRCGVHHAEPVVGHRDVARVVEKVHRGCADHIPVVAGSETDAAKNVRPLFSVHRKEKEQRGGEHNV
jgi:hypothetical protein